MKKLILVALAVLSTFALAQSANVVGDAQKAYQSQQWPAAANLYEKLTQSEPKNPLYWYRLGNASRQAGDLAKAESAFNQASQLGFQPMYVALGLASVEAQKGDREKALDRIEKMAANGMPVSGLIEGDSSFQVLSSEPRFVKALESMKEQAAPCKNAQKSPQYRQFDFWIGTWDVYGKGGAVAGHSDVKLILGDCVINENWTDSTGGEGKSYNKYNAFLKRWEQYWVDQYGSTTYYIGNLEGPNMVFLADNFDPSGKPAKLRMTFFPMPEGKVRQFGETSMDDGKTWTTSFDLTYVKHQ
jgi:tetratricopeptide (TPR) repeat protein